MFQRFTQPEMALDVLNYDRAVVDQDANRQRKAAERHGIQRLAARIHHQQGGDDRQGNGGKDDEGQSPVAEEQQDHQRSQCCGHQSTQRHAVQRGFDEHGLIENRLDGYARGQQPFDVRQRRAHAIDDGERGNAAGLANRHEGAGGPIHGNRIRLHLESVMHVGDIAHENGVAVDLLDRESVDRVERVRTVVHRQRVVLAADLHIPGRQDHILALERLADIRGGQAARLQCTLVEIRHHDSRFAAVGIRHFGAVHDGKTGPNDVLSQVVQLGIRERLARQAQLDDRNVGGAIAQHQRRRDVARHVLQHDQCAARQLRDGTRHIGAFVQIDFLDADAHVAGGLDAGDIVHKGGELALVQRQDPVLHVLRAHAAVRPDHACDRDLDLRKNVDRHA